MVKTVATASAVCLLTFNGQTIAQDDAGSDCALAARYYGIAQDRLDDFNEPEATRWLDQAVAACPQFTYLMELAQIRMESLEREDKALAAEHFVRAHELAQTDSERIEALYGYADLLNQDGDPQNANVPIQEARKLDPGNAKVEALAARIEEQIRNPQRDQLVRGLGDSLYRPLRIPEQRSTVSPSLNIPINFEYNSTLVDARTAQNIQLIAEVLEDEQFAGKRFVFIGHADRRGDPDYNLRLSEERAQAIYREVVQIDSNLRDRIIVIGRGSTQPIDFGTTEAAYRANRRLQIVLE